MLIYLLVIPNPFHGWRFWRAASHRHANQKTYEQNSPHAL